MKNEIVHGDCLEKLSDIQPSSVDLVIADPPYNLSKGGTWKHDPEKGLSGMGGAWDKTMEDWDDMSLDEYMKFTREWLSLVKRTMKPTASMWIFGTYHNTGIINVACQLLKIEIINEVIWYKRNAFPNLAGRRLTASHENIIWCHAGSGRRDYHFDYEYSKDGDFSYDGLKSPGKQMRTVWDISNNKEKSELAFGKHPTQKPLRILDRIIRLSTKRGDLVLSPFSGSGSECVAAKMAGRNYIGIEKDEGYCELAGKRLSALNMQASLMDES